MHGSESIANDALTAAGEIPFRWGLLGLGGYGGFVGASYVYNVGRTILDPDWRAWVNDQYGSLANAEQIWGLAAPLDAKGQLTNPTDDQVANDGPWRVMVDAYRRFMEKGEKIAAEMKKAS